jgi:hypothetical protein
MKRLPTFCALLLMNMVAVSATGFAQTAPAGATNFAMVGLTNTQTLRENMVAFTNAPCAGTLGFFNAAGMAVGPTKTINLSAGQSASLDLKGKLVAASGQRTDILAVFTVAPGYTSGPCRASAEVFGGSAGATAIAIDGVSGYPPDPVFGMAGLTNAYTSRLNLVAFTHSPCAGEMSFEDASGNVLAGPVAVTLNPGQAAFLDLNGASFIPSGKRAEVHAVVSSVTGGQTNCVGSVEVFNNTNLQTKSYYTGGTCDPSSNSCLTH